MEVWIRQSMPYQCVEDGPMPFPVPGHMVKAWTERDPFEWRGEHFNYDCVSILPRPLQVPHPDVWTTCSSEQSLQWAASKHFKLVAPGTVTQTSDIINYYRNYAETQC